MTRRRLWLLILIAPIAAVAVFVVRLVTTPNVSTAGPVEYSALGEMTMTGANAPKVGTKMTFQVGWLTNGAPQQATVREVRLHQSGENGIGAKTSTLVVTPGPRGALGSGEWDQAVAQYGEANMHPSQGAQLAPSVSYYLVVVVQGDRVGRTAWDRVTIAYEVAGTSYEITKETGVLLCYAQPTCDVPWRRT